MVWGCIPCTDQYMWPTERWRLRKVLELAELAARKQACKSEMEFGPNNTRSIGKQQNRFTQSPTWRRAQPLGFCWSQPLRRRPRILSGGTISSRASLVSDKPSQLWVDEKYETLWPVNSFKKMSDTVILVILYRKDPMHCWNGVKMPNTKNHRTKKRHELMKLVFETKITELPRKRRIYIRMLGYKLLSCLAPGKWKTSFWLAICWLLFFVFVPRSKAAMETKSSRLWGTLGLWGRPMGISEAAWALEQAGELERMWCLWARS